MWTYRFWQFTFERAVKTFAQSLLAVLGVGGIGLLSAPWTTALSTAAMAAMLSVLTSVASEPVGEHDSPSVLPSGRSRPQPASRTSVPA